MGAIGGSIQSVSIDGRIFAVAADADGNRDLGGMSNSVEANGDGTARLIQTRKPWKLDGLTLSVDDSRGDQEYLQNVADKHAFVACGITLTSGEEYSGTGQVVDNIEFSTQNATAKVQLMGQGKLTKQ